MVRLYVLFAAGVLLLAGTAVANGPEAEAPASGDCAQQVAAQVQTHYDAVRDLSADFVQVTRSISLGAGALSDAAPRRGRVVLAKPGRMRWDYVDPESLLVSDGSVLWIYDPAAREAQRLPVAEGYLTGAALQFLLGDGRLLEAFEISASECGAELATLDLVPREDASYERLGLRADPRSGAIVESTITDLLGNRTSIAFSNVATNTAPELERFRFEPPEGVEVFDLAPAP